MTFMPFICMAPSPIGADHRPLRIRHLRGQRVGGRGAERSKRARERALRARRNLRSRPYQLATEPLSAVTTQLSRQPRRKLPENTLRVYRIGGVHRAAFQQLPPIGEIILDRVSPFRIGLLFEERQQRS